MLRKIERGFKSLLRGKRGQGITEYAAILAVVVAIAVLISTDTGGFKKKITGLYDSVGEKLDSLSTEMNGAPATKE